MNVRLQNIDENETFLINKTVTTLGKKNCDIKLKSGPSIEATHAILKYEVESGAFIISDNSTCHGTYVNDCRIKDTGIKLSHGDIIRIGHGGPRFNVLIGDTPERKYTKMSNLPMLEARKSPTKSHSACHYGRQNGYIGHNKTEKSSINTIPHPPPRSRPVSASTLNGSFQQSNKATVFGNWTNGYPANESRSHKAIDSVVQLDARLQETEEKLEQLASFEVERLRKDSEICSLRDEVDYLRLCIDRNNTSFVSGCHEKISALRNQIQVKIEDNQNLLDENEKLKVKIEELASTSDNEVMEMKARLSQCDHKILLLEKEFKKANKEKMQTSLLVTTLQKEVTSKNELVIKTKEEVEKYRNDARIRESELSSLAAKIEKQEKEITRDLKAKEEDIRNLKNYNNNLENNLRKKENEIHDMNEQLSEAKTKLSQNESFLQEDRSCYIENTQRLSNALSEMEKRLIENGRSCKNLKQEIDTLQNMDVPDHTSWVKECIMSFLTHESMWEEEIEDALLLVSSESEREGTSPSLLIKMVHEKVDSNLKEINLLEEKINSAENDHSKMYDSVKKEIKDKYKKKTEKALKEVKVCEEERLLEEVKKIREEEQKNMANALAEQQVLLSEEAGKVALLKDEIRRLEKECEDSRNELEASQRSLKESKENEEILLEKVEENIEMFRAKEENRIGKELELFNKIEALESENNSLKIDINAVRRENEENDRLKEECRKNDELNFLKKSETLESENKEMQIKINKTREELMESRDNERLFSDKLKEVNEAYETLETKHNRVINEEVNVYKEKLDCQSAKITFLEYTIIALEKEKEELENHVKSFTENADIHKQTEKRVKKQESSIASLTNELEESKNVNHELKKNHSESERKRNEQEAISKALKYQLDIAVAKLSDLKGELSDKEKQKMEHLEGTIARQENEMKEQETQLLKLSTLVEEQKMKLLEQEKYVEQLNAIIETKDVPKSQVIDDIVFTDIPRDFKRVGERCIEKGHDRVIAEQNVTISELRNMVNEVSPSTTVTIHNLPTHQIAKMSQAIDSLKEELTTKEYNSNMKDQSNYDEIVAQQESLKSTSHELSVEKESHNGTQNALDMSEELYLKFAADLSSALDIQEVLGCKPLQYMSDDERGCVLKERAKGLEVILNRIKSLQSRLERKEQLLESYDNDLKNLRETESYAGQKTAQVKHLEEELTESKNEIAYLQEALKKWRNECDELRRYNNSLKQRKVFKMDYKEEPSPLPKPVKGRKNKQIYYPRLDISEDEPVRESATA